MIEKDFESISKKVGYFSNVLLKKNCRNHSLSVAIVDFFERWERSGIFDERNRRSAFSVFYWGNEIDDVLFCEV